MAISTIDPNGLNVGQLGGRRNLLINSGFDVWQRGTSFTGSGYTADRWIVSTTESGTAITKTANRDKRNTLRVTFGSTISCNLDQRIEAFGNVGYNQQVTLSFYVRGSRATTTDFCRIRNHTTATTLETLTYDITTSWAKVTKTFSANNTWSKDDVARLYLFTADASSPWTSADWVEFSDVQLELGDVATPHEHRSYGEELSACQRFYHQTSLYGQALTNGIYHTEILWHSYLKGASTWEFLTTTFPTTMRTAPSITLSDKAGTTGKMTTYTSTGGGSAANATAYSIYSSIDGVRVTDYNSSIYGFGYEYKADAEL